MNKITFITGGARSGKSTQALTIAMQYKKRGFIATAIPFDNEMKERIKKHKAERGKNFITIEEPLNLAGAITLLEKDVDIIVIDCVSVWLGNLLFKYGLQKNDFKEINSFYERLKKFNGNIIIVSNEVGSGIIPENKSARYYRDLAGLVNQTIAGIADEVIFMISGIPTQIKGKK
jgi:adenosylcobinamide kinase/adenosylcobinamide-phosphate guanylyltransferase